MVILNLPTCPYLTTVLSIPLGSSRISSMRSVQEALRVARNKKQIYKNMMSTYDEYNQTNRSHEFQFKFPPYLDK